MGTNVEQVYDIALITIRDYRLDNLAKADYSAFLKYLQGLLVKGIPEFTGNILGDLTIEKNVTVDEDGNEITTYSFTRDLTSKEISILAETVVYNWVQSIQNDAVLLRAHLGVKEFKQLEISASMKQRSEYIDKLFEKIHYDITQLQLDNFDELSFFGKDNN